jgi:hypothetical protein
VLNSHGYTLRERVKVKKGKPDPHSRDVTLKFRTPDLIVAAEALPAKGKAKFEEDITPFLVRTVNPNGSETTSFVQPSSMRSLFSVSITKDLEPSDRLLTLADASAMYPDLQQRLKLAGATAIQADAKLTPGLAFHELVFGGASVDLGAKVDAEFDFSLWYERGMLVMQSLELPSCHSNTRLVKERRQELPPGAHSRSSGPYNPISRSGRARTVSCEWVRFLKPQILSIA